MHETLLKISNEDHRKEVAYAAACVGCLIWPKETTPPKFLSPEKLAQLCGTMLPRLHSVTAQNIKEALNIAQYRKMIESLSITNQYVVSFDRTRSEGERYYKVCRQPIHEIAKQRMEDVEFWSTRDRLRSICCIESDLLAGRFQGHQRASNPQVITDDHATKTWHTAMTVQEKFDFIFEELQNDSALAVFFLFEFSHYKNKLLTMYRPNISPSAASAAGASSTSSYSEDAPIVDDPFNSMDEDKLQ